MAFSLSVTAFPQLILRDFRRSHGLAAIIAASPMSQLVMAQMKSANPGGWAFDAKLALWEKSNTNALISDGYQTASSYPSANFDPSAVSYAKPSESTINPKVDRIALATTRLADLDVANHPDPGALLRIAVEDSVAQLQDQMSEMAILEMITAGQRETGSGVGASFGLDFSSDSNLITDLKQLAKARESQSKGQAKDWLLALNPIYRPQFSMIASGTLGSSDYLGGSNVSLTEASAGRVAGFDLVFDESVPTGGGVALNLEKVALLIPQAPVTKHFSEKDDPLSSFYSTHMLWGFATLGKTIQALDGVAVSGAVQKEGLIKLAIV